MNRGALVLEARRLRVEFIQEGGQATRAVNELDFELYRGQTLGLVGESGSGKSATALALMGLLPKNNARVGGSARFFPGGASQPVELFDLRPSAWRRIRGRRIAMVFQEPMTSLNPILTCGEQITEIMGEPRREARRQALALLETTRLVDPERIFRAYPHQLSGGQRQRVMIAMALAHRPDILVADEPTTALDVSVQAAILELIGELRQSWGGAILFITHDLGVMAQVADRVLVMREGEKLEEGALEEVLRAPRHAYTRGLLACRPRLDHKARRLPLVEDFLEAEEKGEMPAVSIVAPEEVSARLEGLSKQAPLFAARDLKVAFAVRRDWLGRPRSVVRAVDGVSFEVYPGETLGLVGESGSGKTTLGRALLGLVRPSEGEILYQNQPVSRWDEARWRPLRKDMQIIFQDPFSSLNPRMTVGAAIMEPMRVHRLGANDEERRERARHLLEMVRLDAAHFHRYPHEFSGGQRQRICIARALAVSPRFLVCDEPVSSLDVSVQARILNLLASLRESLDLTYVFISHDLAAVKFISDRIMVMRAGRMEEIGPAESVYRSPQSEYTRGLIKASPRLDL
jgi:peptide/nickel transport system ATP-binding protein